MTRTAYPRRIGSILLSCGLFCGCVEGAGEAPHGTVSYGAPSTASLASMDFGDPAAQQMFPTAGNAGLAAPLMAGTDGVGMAGTGITAVQAGTTGGAAGAAGTMALPNTAGTSAAGAAGMSAAGKSGAGGAGGEDGAAGSTMPAASGGTLKVDITTEPVGGRYAPRNVGAIRIANSSGTFIKTLKRWAGIRAAHLTTWAAASGDWGGFFGGGNVEDQADAISGATLRSHETHSLTWDLKDLSGTLVPNGKYKVMLEVADDNRAQSATTSGEFEKGPAPQTVMVPPTTPAASFKLDYQP